MKAQSKVYIQLQNIYKSKARQDVAEVLEIARTCPRGQNVDPEEVELFCKNAAFVKLINTEVASADRLAQVAGESHRLSSGTCVRLCHWSAVRENGKLHILTFATGDELANDENLAAMMMPLSLIPIYLALFATSHAPGASSEEILSTIETVVPNAAGNERLVQAAREVARAGGGELHNTSALTGGMVAQEIIKIVTKQYVPVDNTCIFDGISSRCQVLRL